MALSDLKFIFWFVPVFMIIYVLAGAKLKRIVLPVSGLCFYYFGAGIPGLLFYIGSALLNYVSAILISKTAGGIKKLILILTLLVNFGVLLFFKYANLVSVIIPEGFGFGSVLQELVMPLGISFYTFSFASYVIDVYRGTIAADRDIITYSGYAAFFPKLISGPIVRYGEMQEKLKSCGTTRENIEDGFCTFVIGFGMKVLIADSLAPVWEHILSIGFESISTPLAWIGALSFSLRLYFDFNGYSLMAMGIGKMCGFDLPANFDLPYLSRSISEFWRRWHITLGTWFRDYVYIPLGGSKNGKLRLILSLSAVWLCTGIWHGSTFNYILWGLCLLTFILLERFLLNGFLEKHPAAAHFYVCFVIVQTWVVFAIPDIRDIGNYFTRLYPFLRKANEFVYFQDYVEVLKSKWPFLAAGLFFCLPFFRKWYEKNRKSPVVTVMLFVVFWASVYMIAKQGSNPFMYCSF